VSQGLTTAQAREALRRYGRNEVVTEPGPHLPYRIGRQLVDPLILLLLAAATVTALLRDATDTAVILLVIVVNTTVGVAQEVRADKAVAALRRLGAPTARVVRDGTEHVGPAADLVPEDLVVLAAGDVVPADVRLVEAYRLSVDESALTGESVPVDRSADDELSAGTVLVTGRGRAVVTRTGGDSSLGRIARLVATARPGPTPLQKRLSRLGRVLGAVVVVLSALVTVLGVLAGEPLVRMAVTGVSLVVAAVPESLPAVVTLALALGAKRMARAHAIARRLHAVETLGSVTVLCLDKTGTVTEGRMAVRTAVAADGEVFEIDGTGYSPDGRVGGDLSTDLVELARAGVLCNDARLRPPTDDRPEWTVVGDPVEGALLAFAGRCGLDVAAVRAAAPRTAEEPFDPLTRRMTTVHSGPSGPYRVRKGAPEAVLAPGDPLLDQAGNLAAQGLRVLAVAAGTGALRPLGLVAIGDPLRSGAAEVAAACDRAGIRVLLVTGDHPATAQRIATDLGVWRAGDRVVRGDDGPLDHGDLDRVAVFARTRPEQKLDIVAGLQRQGHVVAMTGDGVNDAPALRRADIGVAMGAGGTEVARQAADLVLADDNLGTVVAAVHEGRRVYDNIRRFLRYALSGGVAELLVMLAGPLVGLAVPLLPAQILWINLLTHGLPGVALGAEPASPHAMRRPPRSPQESVLGAGLTKAVLGIGTVISLVALGGGVLAHRYGAPAQTMVFLILGLAQLGVALAVRAPRHRGTPGNPWLGWAVALSAVLLLGAVVLVPLRVLLGTAALTPPQLLVAVVVAALPGAGLALARRRWSEPQPPEPPAVPPAEIRSISSVHG
jgi:P-type Ca2+ transporter type 2C